MIEMEILTFRYLKFVEYKDFKDWNARTYFSNMVAINESLVPIGRFIKQAQLPISKKKVEEKGISIISKISFGGELFLRPKEEVRTYKGNIFLVKPNQFIFSKIRARNGCVYFHNQEFEFAVSSEYPTLEYDEKQVNGEYLRMVLRSDYFKELLEAKSTGGAKARMTVKELLSIEIPLPIIETQFQIVADYQKAISEAAVAERRSAELEKEIERYLNETLGIEVRKTELKKGLQFVQSKDLTRWDLDFLIGGPNDIFSVLKKAKYPLKKLGDEYALVSRSWNRKKHAPKTFRYIEIGSVDPLLGITEATELEVSNAPSRATQTVKTNDLILGLTRPYLKKFALVTSEFNDNVCSSGFQVIEPKDGTNLDFLLEYLKSVSAVKQFEYFMTGGLYPAITSQQLKNLQIPLPPSGIQQTIIEKVNKMKAEIKQLNAQATASRDQAKRDFEKVLFST